MKRFSKILLGLTLVLLVAALIGNAFAANEKVGWPKEIRFGVIPTESSATLTDRYNGLANYLSKELGIKVTMFFASDYRGVIEAMRFQKIEIAHLGPLSYVEASDMYGNVEPSVRYIADNGSPGYRSCILANTKTKIYCPEDAKGATFAFNDPNSTSGYLLPMLLFMKEMKINPEKYFSKVIFSGSHEASILAVGSGNVDVASTNINDYKLVLSNNKIKETDVRVIWISSLIPNDPLVVRKDLPVSFRKALQQTLVDVKTKDADSLKSLKWSALTAADDGDYQTIREMNKLKQSLNKNKPK